MTSIDELRAAIADAEDTSNALAIGTEPTAVPFNISKRAQVKLLEQRRQRYLDEARNVTEDRIVLSGTETLFVQRLLDAVGAIDAELPRYRELASADEQHANTMRTFGVPKTYSGD